MPRARLLLALFVGICLPVGLAACGSSNPSDAPRAPAPQINTPVSLTAPLDPIVMQYEQARDNCAVAHKDACAAHYQRVLDTYRDMVAARERIHTVPLMSKDGSPNPFWVAYVRTRKKFEALIDPQRIGSLVLRPSD